MATTKATITHPPHTSARQRGHARHDDGNAFFADPGEGPAQATEELAQVLAEDFVVGATSGEQPDEDELRADLPEELGGPVVMESNDHDLED